MAKINLVVVAHPDDEILGYNPSRIFTHHPSDLNNDHLQVSRACMAYSRLFQRSPKKTTFESLHIIEILSSTDWSFPGYTDSFQPNFYVEVKEELELKIEALKPTFGCQSIANCFHKSAVKDNVQ